VEVETEKVKYATVGGGEVHGFFARPKDPEEPVPGIIAIHEWWGLNDNIRNVTKLLAGEGYRVLAVDLYEGETAETPEAAKKLMSKAMADKERVKENLSDAYNYVSSERNARRVGVIGWCFGGGWSLQTALMLPKEIDATAIYYGELVTDAETLKPLEMPVIGFFGTEDSAVSPDKVDAFKKAMNKAGNDITIHNYEGADHAFANPSGERYDPDAAMDAWKKTLAFFDTHLMQPLEEGAE
jgi:carboxymethylenebutenolidase